MSKSKRTSQFTRGIDLPAYLSFFALAIIGWLSLFAATYTGAGFSEVFSLSTEIGRQTIWLGLSVIGFFAIYSIDWKFWSTFAYVIYGVAIFLLIAVLIFGNEVKGSTSWFNIAGFSFQPSEFAKLATCLAVASLLGSTQINVKHNKHFFLALGLTLVPAFLVLLQPDAGSAMVFSSFLILFYRAGANSLYYVLGIAFVSNVILSLVFGITPVLIITFLVAIGVLMFTINSDIRFMANFLLLSLACFVFYQYDYVIPIFAVLSLAIISLSVYMIRENKLQQLGLTAVSAIVSVIITLTTKWSFTNLLLPHQQDRINVWLRPDLCEPRGSLYNIIQSKTAIGSGGLFGSGFLNGAMTKLDFVPEQNTDFIFCTVGEEHGFLGVLGVIILFFVLLYRIIVMAERTRLDFIRYYMYAVAGIIFFHVFVNIGMTMGIMPVVGIPLPLMSKGGTSILVFFLMIGILFKMDLTRNR